MPFITEAIWQKLNELAPHRGPGETTAEPVLGRARWPRADAAMINEPLERRFALLQEIIRQIRNVRTQHAVPPGKKVSAIIEAAGAVAQLVGENADLLKSLAMLDNVTLAAPGKAHPPSDAAAIAVEDVKVHVLGIVDKAAERARLAKQAAALRNGVKAIRGKLASQGFLAKAPPAVVESERQRLAGLEKELAAVETSLKNLQ